MNSEISDVVIIGGGLTGLALNYFLKDSGLDIKIIESRPRPGGRIFTKYNSELPPLDMGATWLGEKHKELVRLIAELELGTFEQKIGATAIYEAISTSPPYLAQLPPNPEPSIRIAEGSSALINRLVSFLKPGQLTLNIKVESIEKKEGYVKLLLSDGSELLAKKVVSTLPPYLLQKTIEFFPELPEDFIQVASETHTWMGESIKIALTYKKPFWRAEHLSGTLFSNVGPVSEMYDHSNVADNRYALKGFLNGSYWRVSEEERLEVILNQLRKYYGSEVDHFMSYEEKVWRNDEATFVPYDSDMLPHQYNGHSVYRKTYMDGHLLIGGTETATSYSGYMEGAVVSAKEMALKLNI